MTYKSQGDDVTLNIEECRKRVIATHVAYSKGEVGVDAVNKADRALVNAQQHWQAYYNGNIPVR